MRRVFSKWPSVRVHTAGRVMITNDTIHTAGRVYVLQKCKSYITIKLLTNAGFEINSANVCSVVFRPINQVRYRQTKLLPLKMS